MKIVRWGFMEIFLDFIPLTNTFQKFRTKQFCLERTGSYIIVYTCELLYAMKQK